MVMVEYNSVRLRALTVYNILTLRASIKTYSSKLLLLIV